MKLSGFLAKAAFGTAWGAIATLSCSLSAKAETLASFCGYIPDSGLQTPVLEDCTFSWNTDAVEIDWENGIHTRFELVEGESGLYTDQRGSRVYAQRSHVGADAQFRLENGAVLVYWKAQQPTANL